MAARINSNKLTEVEIARRRTHVVEVLGRKPEITLTHFKRAFGYDYDWLKSLEAEGIKFGKPVKKHLKLSNKKNPVVNKKPASISEVDAENTPQDGDSGPSA